MYVCSDDDIFLITRLIVWKNLFLMLMLLICTSLILTFILILCDILKKSYQHLTLQLMSCLMSYIQTVIYHIKYK